MGFPLFKALADDARREMNAMRTTLKAQERNEWQATRDHSAALAEDRKVTAERRRKAEEAKRKAPIDDNGQVKLKVFERMMLTGGA